MATLSSYHPLSLLLMPSYPRNPNKLRKPPPPSFSRYPLPPPLSFIPDDPPTDSHFPVSLHSPGSSSLVASASSCSQAPLLPEYNPHRPTAPTRKLTKRRPSLPSQSYAPLVDVPSQPLSRAKSSPVGPSHPPMPTARSQPQPLLPPAHVSRSGSTRTISLNDSPPSRPPPKRSLSLLFARSKRTRSPARSPRSSVSENGHDWLPPVRPTSPFHVPPADVSYESSTDIGGWRSTWSIDEYDDAFGGGFAYSDTGHRDGPLTGHRRATFTLGTDEDVPFTTSPASSDPPSPTPPRPVRPRLHRRDPIPSARRRWTLAMAMTDDDISDEVLVEELERMRIVGAEAAWWSAPADTPPSLPPVRTSWHTLLTIRELVRTERRYLAALRALVQGRTAAAPPPLMLTYATGLVRASERLLDAMERGMESGMEDGGGGVASAFVACEAELERAFVEWCAVVGAWFEEAPKRRVNRGSPGDAEGGDTADASGGEDGKAGALGSLRRVGTWRRSMPSLPSLGMLREREKRAGDAGSVKLPSVRDLAILPTQRVMRYVLLYRDLLSHTPAPAPARALVERAVEAACRIAAKCDRAQGNSAFLRR